MELTRKFGITGKASSHKKPAASATIYLRAAAANQINKVEPLPPTKEHWAEYERLRELVRRLRKNGFSPWVPVSFAAAIAVLFLLWLAARTHTTRFYQFPSDYLRVIQNLNLEKGDFVMQRVTNGVPGPEFEAHFRGDLPKFENGHTLQWIRFVDTGSEQILDGWDLVREDKLTFAGGQWRRMPTIAPNCVPDWTVNHVICEGGKARF